MSLREKVADVAALLDERPSLERLAALAAAVNKLGKALDDFLAKSVPEMHKNTAEYAELSALLSQQEYKSVVTLDWLNRHAAPCGKKYAKVGKREKEDFAVTMVGAGLAPAVLQELKESPRRKMQDLLYALARQRGDEAAAEIKAMKPKQLEEFCRHNDIPVERSARGGVDKKRTLPHITAKLDDLREYLKL